MLPAELGGFQSARGGDINLTFRRNFDNIERRVRGVGKIIVGYRAE
jgi:hypothetical protein